MTKSSSGPTQVSVNLSQNGSQKNKVCCSSKKIISYSCKVRCMTTICILLLAAAAALIYFLFNTKTTTLETFISLPKKVDWFPQCPSQLLNPEERFDCYPDDTCVDQAACEARGCCFVGRLTSRYDEDKKNDSIPNEIPSCVYPKNYGYAAVGKAEAVFNGFEVPLRRMPAPSRYGDDMQFVNMKIETQTKYRLRIKFYDPESSRYEVPMPKVPVHSSPSNLDQNEPEVFLYSVTYDTVNKPFAVKVRRSATDAIVFDTSVGALTLSNHFLELTTKLPSSKIYGLGQHMQNQYHHDFRWQTYNMFSKKTEAVGRSILPPYWSLGLHVGSSVYHATKDMKELINKFKTGRIPLETLILEHESISKILSKNEKFSSFSNFATRMENNEQKFIMSLDPNIPKDATPSRDSLYGVGMQHDVFITDKWGLNPIEGRQNGKITVYPDFGRTSAITWWTNVIKRISSTMHIDGLWLVNNEPSSEIDGSLNGCLDDDLNRPPYIPKSLGNIYQKTLCMNALSHWREDIITHYDSHNFYGHSMVMATEEALNIIYPNKRKLIVTDSTFVGSGQYAGHWIRGLGYGWEALHASIPIMLELGLYGVAFSGASMCGDVNIDLNEEQEELCLRWLQLGIFYPLFQLHGTGAEYLYTVGLNKKEFSHALQNTLSRRYELMPYLYTLLYLAHTKGSTVMRPLFHEFPHDNETYAINTQFMWGSSLLISPVLEKGVEELNFYLPKGIWYDFYRGGVLYSAGEWFLEREGLFKDSKQPVALHIKAGHIITVQNPAETTAKSRQNSMSLLVALDSSNKASGLLFWDDGITKNSHLLGEYVLVECKASGTSLVVNGILGKKVFMSTFYQASIQQVRIMGLNKPPKRIIIDGSYILSNKQYHWNIDTKVLDLKHFLIPLGRRTEVQWVF
ncbi:sucrase-isomaltase, intestinal-like isoform X2 [Stegodyphus dumicola]|uniref:sucrase-isomaltase, intestinal-like isoform X2 n=1 Tax=Stegodyphus dumicola TaxID=202533 RepID=UPI0015AAC01E|nr:sucrase-isomaltase, intestinal-like isoform X2 [Stegodyphus dumicola]